MEQATDNQTLRSRIIKTELIHWRELEFIQQDDFKDLPEEAMAKLKNSLLANMFTTPFYVWQDEVSGKLYCLDGKHRTLALNALETDGHTIPDELPAVFIQADDIQDAARLVLIFSSVYAKITTQGLHDFLGLYELKFEDVRMTVDLPDFDLPAFQDFDSGNVGGIGSGKAGEPLSLAERFGVPPFSVLDSRQGYWQDRKRAWHAQGINSQETREEIEVIAKSGQSSGIYALRNKMREEMGRDPSWEEILDEAKRRGMHIYEGASVFDPVLCEIAYLWFCPEKAQILDPFAGGSVRGIVAAKMGHDYHGIDLRTEQVEANRRQAEALELSGATWYAGDSLRADELLPENLKADFVFSCPPYHDLEKYSDDPDDLSNMPYQQFIETYRKIITKAMSRLKQDRFACFVVGDIRDPKTGFYRNFVSDTIKAFQDADPTCKLYNEIILLNVAGSVPIRAGRQMEVSRKVGKMHQNVLVFYKGDPKAIRDNFPLLPPYAFAEPEPEVYETSGQNGVHIV